MKKNTFIIILFLLSSCSANHQYDGLYLANTEIRGVTKAWILDGDELTIYSAGVVSVKRCVQYPDRLEVEDDNTYAIDQNGEIIIARDSSKNLNYRMLKFSDRTKYTFGELDKLVADAYENERRKRFELRNSDKGSTP